MTSSTSQRRRHVPLGARLEAAERIRAGEIAVADACRELGVEAGEVERWVASGERPVSVAEVLASPAERRLTRRAERLVALIAAADALIAELHARLAAECKKFGRFAQQASPP
jgi:transposase-like protein